MVLTIKIKNNEEYKKLDKFLKDNSIEIVEDDSFDGKDTNDLRKVFSKYSLKLPKGFKFDREEANAR
ncbi:MAG TPA: hypothetical protein PK605_10450 [Ignavibacteria bacterium]|nr:hypothetical protein [Ignavibacteria bacterium]HAX48705.1 hypothetical protein [Bacteroidota bacterium]HRE09955.1 hypothetical protein [Ignavibacteria bacterium]HRF66976.1 hypothetical protein [Ignavibacteria bacterium]HRJ04808.1 hypothetical protein [Ignavibacteria bacterium]